MAQVLSLGPHGGSREPTWLTSESCPLTVTCMSLQVWVFVCVFTHMHIHTINTWKIESMSKTATNRL